MNRRVDWGYVGATCFFGVVILLATFLNTTACAVGMPA